MKGAPQCGGLLQLSHFHCGDGCLSLAARYQRAFWEAAPQGPPRSGLCLFLSHHILAFFFPPLICFIPVLDLSLPFLHHPWITFVTLRVMSWPNSNELFPQSQNCTGLRNWIHNDCFFFLIRNYLWVKWFSFIWLALWHIFTYLLCRLLMHGCSCEERAGV